MAPRRRASVYPAKHVLHAVLAEVAAVNAFSAAHILDKRRSGCCKVQHLPSRRAERRQQQQQARGGGARRTIYYGTNVQGYVVVSCTAALAKDAWPTCAKGTAFRPIRLHRWVAAVAPGKIACHQCDVPSCIAWGCIVCSTASANNADTHKRRRRKRQRDAAAAQAAAPPIVDPSPRAPSAPATRAFASRTALEQPSPAQRTPLTRWATQGTAAGRPTPG
jgi:hypothetical protein